MGPAKSLKPRSLLRGSLLQQELYSDWTVKVIKILAMIDDDRAVEPLTKMMRNISRGDIMGQIGIIESLSQINSSKAIESLTNMLNDDELQIPAALALAGMGSDRANDLLLKLLNEVDGVKDSIASYSLGLIGTQEAIIPMVKHFRKRLQIFGSIRSEAGEMLISESYSDLYRLSLRIGIKITRDMIEN